MFGKSAGSLFKFLTLDILGVKFSQICKKGLMELNNNFKPKMFKVNKLNKDQNCHTLKKNDQRFKNRPKLRTTIDRLTTYDVRVILPKGDLKILS